MLSSVFRPQGRRFFTTDIAVKKLQEELTKGAKDTSTKGIVIDYTKCKPCARCAQVCEERVLAFSEFGGKPYLQTRTGDKLCDMNCTQCGQCTLFCPTGAISVRSEVDEVKKELKETKSEKIVFFDPSIPYLLSDALKIDHKNITAGKIVTLLKGMGFDKCYDGGFGTDIAIIEETDRFISNIEKGDKGLVISGFCPAVVSNIKKARPDLAPMLSGVHTPSNALAALIRYINKDSYIVSISSCVAQKQSAIANHHLTTKELLEICKGVDFSKIEESKFDAPFDTSSGAAAIVNNTGGMTEAVLRIAHQALCQNPLPSIEYHSLRGLKDSLKMSIVECDKQKIKVAVAQGTETARSVCDHIINGDKSFSDVRYLEATACPGGCVNGGGNTPIDNFDELINRADHIYKKDSQNPVRKSILIKVVESLYKEHFDGESGSPSARKVLSDL